MDDDGFLVKEYSLSHKNALTLQMSLCSWNLCVANVEWRLLITTKYHAEYAGEGIGYSWGAAKALYRQYPIYSKQGKENFLDLVSKCTLRDVMTTELICKFSMRAQNYMLT